MNPIDGRQVFAPWDYTRVLMSFAEYREAVWCGLIQSGWRRLPN